MFEIEVKKDEKNLKPLNFLKKRLDIPYFLIPLLIKKKRITLNKKKIKKESILKEGDKIQIWDDKITLRKKEEQKKESKNLNIEKIFENENFLVLNKPPFVTVQGAQDNELSISYHLEYLKNKNNDTNEYFHAHRLDKETSGILIISKNKPTLREFNKIFREKKVTKKYYALVLGIPRKYENKNLEFYLKRTEPNSKKKVVVVNKSKNDKQKNNEIKLSLTKFKILETFKKDGETFSLLDVEIKTGITHQIRVVLSHLGYPILGDKMYGNSLINEKFNDKLNRHFLHSHYIKFNLSNKKYEFDIKLYEDLQKFINFIQN